MLSFAGAQLKFKIIFLVLAAKNLKMSQGKAYHYILTSWGIEEHTLFCIGEDLI